MLLLNFLLDFTGLDRGLLDGSNGFAGPAERWHGGGLGSTEFLIPVGRSRSRFHRLDLVVLFLFLGFFFLVFFDYRTRVAMLFVKRLCG